MGMCSINVAEMRSLVSSLQSAQSTVRSEVSILQSTLSSVLLGDAQTASALPVASWIGDELVPTRRRLAMAEALQAATPNRSNYVNFDESAISNLTPAQAKAQAKKAAHYVKTHNTKALLAILKTESYDPYFATTFAEYTGPIPLENYITETFTKFDDVHGSTLKPGVNKQQYELVLDGIAQTLGLATRNTGDIALPTSWRNYYADWMSDPSRAAKYSSPNQGDGSYGTAIERRGALNMLLARGDFSTPFLKRVTANVMHVTSQPGYAPGKMEREWPVGPNGKPFDDIMVGLMSALSHNPEAAKWAFTQGGTTTMKVSGHDVQVNAFLKKALVDYPYIQGGNSVALLAIQAAVGGNKYSPIALDTRSIATSLKQSKAAWDAMPWYEKWGHQILDLVGCIPFIGDLANAGNAAWYGLQGDWEDAGISGAGMIPFLGDAALGARLTRDGKDALDGVRILQAGEVTGDVITDTKRSLELLKAGDGTATTVLKFDDPAAFKEAASAPHPNMTYEYDGVSFTTNADGQLSDVSGKSGGSIRKINPGGGQMNCGECSLAVDRMLAGEKVGAVDPNAGAMLAIDLEARAGGTFGNATSASNIEGEIAKAGPGARGIVFARRGPGEVGHFFNVVNQKGVVRFLDGQTGKLVDLSPRQGYQVFHLLRTN